MEFTILIYIQFWNRQNTIDFNRKPPTAYEMHLVTLVLLVLIKFLPNVHSHVVDK
jgi:hypothetical protein